MGSNSDRPSGTEKVDTVPPPPGEDDAYSAPTRVGTLPTAVLELMRQKDAEKKAQDAAPPPKPSAAKTEKAEASDRALGKELDDAVEAMMSPVGPPASAKPSSASKPEAPKGEPAKAEPAKVEPAKVEPAKAEPANADAPKAEEAPKEQAAASAEGANDEEEDVATMLFNHPQNAPAGSAAPTSQRGAPAQPVAAEEIEASPQSGPAPTSSALRNGPGEVVSQDILSPEPVASPFAPPPLATSGRMSPAIIALVAALAVALVAVAVLALR